MICAILKTNILTFHQVQLHTFISYMISHPISYLIYCSDIIPPLDQEASSDITGSKEILKAFSSKHSLNARVINDLIKDLLKNPAFNADEVDHDMLKRLLVQASIDSGDIQIIYLC